MNQGREKNISAEKTHQQYKPLELDAITPEEIVDALSSGRPIALPQNTGDFLLNSGDALAASQLLYFIFYHA